MANRQTGDERRKITDDYDRPERSIVRARQLLRTKYGMTEPQADAYIKEHAAQSGISIRAMIARILRVLG